MAHIVGDPFRDVPAEMKAERRWVLWRYETREERTTKVPYSALGGRASVADSNSWSTFESAIEQLADGDLSFDGIGFVLGNGFVGIDVDDCLSDDLQPGDCVADLIQTIGSYVEVSPSGHGIHIIARGSLPPGPRRSTIAGCRLEMYDANRYFTVTGRALGIEPTGLAEATEAIDRVYRRYFGNSIESDVDSATSPEPNMTAEDVLLALEQLSNSESAKALFDGDDSDYDGDTSRADLAFCAHVKKALGSDPSLIDLAYRLSGRFRAKWDEPHSAIGATYGQMTIRKVMSESKRGDMLAARRSRTRLRLIPAIEVPIKAIKWFMPSRIPKSELILFDGDGGIGKTTVALDIIARASAGQLLPDGSTLDHKCRVLILAEEDSLSVHKARLVAAQADLSQISFVSYVDLGGNEQRFALPEHAELLRGAIRDTGTDLFYLDALFSHFSSSLNATKYQDVRRALSPLTRIAHEENVTIIATRHWSKVVGPASHRGLGSTDVRNMSRAALSFGPHPRRTDVPTVYVVAVSKSNYGRAAEALLYQIDSSTVCDDQGKPFEVGVIRWIGEDETTADEIAAGGPTLRSERPLDAACRVFLDALRDGKKTAEELERVREDADITRGTWYKARAILYKEGKIRRTGGGQAGAIYWSLSDDTGTQEPRSA